MNDQWHSAGEELAMLLGDENAALAALDVKRAVSMLEAKAIAVMQFERLRPVQTEQAAAVEMLGRLSLLAQENRRLLDRAIKAQKRVIGVVARLVRETPVAPRYGAKGKLRNERSPLTLSLSDHA